MNRQKPILIVLILFLAACGSPGGERVVMEEGTAVPTPTSSSETAVAPHPTPFPATKYDDLEIVTLLPKDAIPAINDPKFLDVSEADKKYDPDELVIGVAFNGDARAYSIPLLSNHEIVNDTVGGEKIAVTW